MCSEDRLEKTGDVFARLKDLNDFVTAFVRDGEFIREIDGMLVDDTDLRGAIEEGLSIIWGNSLIDRIEAVLDLYKWVNRDGENFLTNLELGEDQKAAFRRIYGEVKACMEVLTDLRNRIWKERVRNAVYASERNYVSIKKGIDRLRKEIEVKDKGIKKMLKESLDRCIDGRATRIQGLEDGIYTTVARITEDMSALETKQNDTMANIMGMEQGEPLIQRIEGEFKDRKKNAEHGFKIM